MKILSEIGDIKHFANDNKLAQFAGIAPLHLSSGGKGKDFVTKQGNRRLQATIYFLAIQMVQVSSKGTPRNPVVRAYYEKHKAEGKTQPAGTDLYFQRINQYYLWNVKAWYGVPYASSGKCWRKCVERMFLYLQ